MKLTYALLGFAMLFIGINSEAQSSVSVTPISNCQTQIVTLDCGSDTNTMDTSVSYQLASNQIATITSAIGFGTIGIVTPGGSTNQLQISNRASNIYINPLPMTFTGLKSVSIVNIQGFQFTITMTVLTPITNSISVTPVNSVVIPSDATGPVQIVLESSSDLVNWIPSLPGTYGNTYTNRFFRVRAIAQ